MHFTRCHLDHCLILLETHLRASNRRWRPFKFQNCWLLDSTFHSVVSQARGGGGGGQAPRLKDAIDRFTRDALAWIKAHFGNIFTKKKNIKARLNGIQQAVSVKPPNFLFNLENELLKKL